MAAMWAAIAPIELLKRRQRHRNPVYLDRYGSHMGLANSLAMKRSDRRNKASGAAFSEGLLFWGGWGGGPFVRIDGGAFGPVSSAHAGSILTHPFYLSDFDYFFTTLSVTLDEYCRE
jgi:hypothetical protein